MANCGQACPYNTLDGCKVKEYNAICPLTNMATPVTEYRMTNADRIRAMSDEELAKVLNAFTAYFEECNRSSFDVDCKDCELYKVCSLYEGNALDWLKQPAEEGDGNG